MKSKIEFEKLRKNLNFKGLIITDDLAMDAVVKFANIVKTNVYCKLNIKIVKNS